MIICRFSTGFFLLVTVVLSASMLSANQVDNSSPDCRIKLGDDESYMLLSSNGVILRICDLKTKSILVHSAKKNCAWRARLVNGGNGSYITSADYPAPQIHRSRNQVMFTWAGKSKPRVTLRFHFDPALKEYRVTPSIAAYPSSLIDELEYPSTLVYDNRNKANYVIGCGTDPIETADQLKPLDKIEKLALVYPGILKMQMLGFKISNSALLVYTDDIKSIIKWHYLDRAEEGLKHRIVHFVRLMPGSLWREPYSVVFRVFPSGGINELTDGYAQWARKQSWAEKKMVDKLKRCPLLERYMRDGCVRFHDPSQSLYVQRPDGEWKYTGDLKAPSIYTQVLSMMEQYETLGVSPGYWWPVWSGQRFDTGYPDYFPVEPFMGDFQAFRDTLIRTRRPMMYHFNMCTWPANSPYFRKDWAATWNGHYWTQTWSNIQHYIMSPGLTLKRELQTVAQVRDDVGVNGIYLDVIGATFATDDNPGSPYISEPNCFQIARNATIKAVREAVTGPLMTESRGEGYLESIDIGFGYIGHFDQDPVPLWQMVYGDCVLLMPYIDRYIYPARINQTCSLGGIIELPISPEMYGVKELAWRQRVLSHVIGKQMKRYDREGHFRISQWRDGVVIWNRPEAAGVQREFSAKTMIGEICLTKIEPNGIVVLMKNGDLIVEGVGQITVNGQILFKTDKTQLAFIRVDRQLLIQNASDEEIVANFNLSNILLQENKEDKATKSVKIQPKTSVIF